MNAWTLIYAIGAAQGVLLAVALLRRGRVGAADRVLAGWMLLVAVDLAVRVWVQTGPGPEFFRLARAVALFPFLHASLFYLYVRSVIHGRGLAWPDLRHGIGFAVGLLLILDLLLLPNEELRVVREAYIRGEFRVRELVVNLALFGWSLSYVGAAVTAIVRHRRRLRATRSDIHPHALRWLVLVAVCQCLIWAIALGQWLLPMPWLQYRMIYAAVAAWVLLVGYMSLMRHQEVAVDSSRPLIGPEAEEAASAATSVDPDPRTDEVAERLRVLMEKQELFREPALSIAQLARRSGYPEYLVSAVINRRFGCPFWDYVNRYRVVAAQRRLLDPTEQRTALDIAYDCGFTSKSTFNAAFKRLLGETPSACRSRAASAGASDGGAEARPQQG